MEDSETNVTATSGDSNADLLLALHGITPLVEPVYITKALRAGRKAKVVLDGAGPKACVMLVNIQLTAWTHNKDTAESFANGYNVALDQLRSALLEVVVAGSSRTDANAVVCTAAGHFKRREDGSLYEVSRNTTGAIILYHADDWPHSENEAAQKGGAA